METTLNLAWVCLAVWMIWRWLRTAPRAGADRRAQFVALAMVLVILWPVISVTDDLSIATRNPAEIDTCWVRRNHDWLAAHVLLPAAIALTVPPFASLAFDTHQRRVPRELAAQTPIPWALWPIDNRPPPAA